MSAIILVAASVFIIVFAITAAICLAVISAAWLAKKLGLE